MKRSEAVQKLLEAIELMRGVDNGYYVYPEDEQMADRLLAALEEIGMQPPAYFNLEFYDEPECDGYLNDWESEDECCGEGCHG